MGQDSPPDSGHNRESVAPFSAVPACLLAGLGAALWLTTQTASGVAFSAWQGPLLEENWVYPVPVLARGVAIAAQWLGPGHALATLNLSTSLALAFAAAMLCAIVIHVAERFAEKPLALLAGFLATGAFVAAPSALDAGLAAHPAPFSLAAALAAIACFAPAVGGRRRLFWDIAAGVAAGLAGANHPTLLLLAPLLLFALLLTPDSGGVPLHRRALSLFLPLALCVLLPGAAALLRGESLRQFLHHALATPYPALFEAPPRFGFLRALLHLLPPAVLLFAVPGLVVLLIPRARPAAWLMAGLLCVMGPLLPALTNQYALPAYPKDEATPELLVLAVLCMFIGWGGALLANAAFRPIGRPAPRAVLAGACLAGLLAMLWPPLPPQGHAKAPALARRLLEACPENGLLLTGDMRLTSLLLAAQHTEGLRADMDIVAASGLEDPTVRKALSKRLSANLVFPSAFPSEEHLAFWEHSRPLDFLQLVQAATPEKRVPLLRQLALWNLVAENASAWPVCFSGCSPRWLMPRADARFGVLCYPGAESSHGLKALLELARDFAVLAPPARRTFAAMLLPVAQSALAQGRPTEALVLARLGRALAPDHPGFRLLELRAYAHRGEVDAVEQRLDELLARPEPLAVPDLEALIHAELLAHQQRQAFLHHISRECEEAPDTETRQDLAAPLWQAQDFAPLREGYQRILETYPEDADALYQLAAVFAELGRWKRAENHIGLWLVYRQPELGAALDLLHRDARFTLYLRYHRHRNTGSSMGSHEAI